MRIAVIVIVVIVIAGCSGKGNEQSGFDFDKLMDPATHEALAGSLQTCTVTKIHNMDRVDPALRYIVEAVPDAAFSGGVKCNNQKNSLQLVFTRADEANAPALKVGQDVRIEITKGSIGAGRGYEPIVVFRLFESEAPR